MIPKYEHPHRCGVCPSYPCWALIEASDTISNLTLSVAIRKILENFTSLIGCNMFPRIRTNAIENSIKLVESWKDRYLVDLSDGKEYVEIDVDEIDKLLTLLQDA